MDSESDEEMTRLDKRMLRSTGVGEEMIQQATLDSPVLKMIETDPGQVRWARIDIQNHFLLPAAKTRAASSAEWHMGNPLGLRYVLGQDEAPSE